MTRFALLIVVILSDLWLSSSFATLTGAMTEKAIVERIKPIGEVTVVGGASPKEVVAVGPVDIGKHRYEQTCQMCHQSGIADSPKLGDKKAWAPRIAQGMETMLKHAMEGLKAMPPKGGCTTCDEEEIRKTIEYMVSQAK